MCHLQVICNQQPGTVTSLAFSLWTVQIGRSFQLKTWLLSFRFSTA